MILGESVQLTDLSSFFCVSCLVLVAIPRPLFQGPLALYPFSPLDGSCVPTPQGLLVEWASWRLKRYVTVSPKT